MLIGFDSSIKTSLISVLHVEDSATSVSFPAFSVMSPVAKIYTS